MDSLRQPSQTSRPVAAERGQPAGVVAQRESLLAAARGALGDHRRSIGAANRYPEFLPERLRALIADHIGVHAEQVVVGAGATGVVMQTLHATTFPETAWS